MPESPPGPATLRSIHERCKTRHSESRDLDGLRGTFASRPSGRCAYCTLPWPCADYSDAVAALALLDAAQHTEVSVEQGWIALVPDPVPTGSVAPTKPTP